MATRKTTRRPAAPRTRNSSSVLDKYGSALKLFANYGFAGLAFGYLLIITIPDAQKTFTTSLEKQADQNREDRKTAFTHAEHAVEKLSGSIDGLKDVFQVNQRAGHTNQRESIAVQEKIVDLLEKQNATKSGDDPPSASIASPKRPPIAEWSEPSTDWQPVRPKASKKASPQ